MPPKLGILAGSGPLPARIVQACRDSGLSITGVHLRHRERVQAVDPVSVLLEGAVVALDSLCELVVAEVAEALFVMLYAFAHGRRITGRAVRAYITGSIPRSP